MTNYSSSAADFIALSNDQSNYTTALAAYQDTTEQMLQMLNAIGSMDTQTAFMYIVSTFMQMPLQQYNDQMSVLASQVNVLGDYQNITSQIQTCYNSMLDGSMPVNNSHLAGSDYYEFFENVNLLQSKVENDNTLDSSTKATLEDSIKSLQDAFGGTWPSNVSNLGQDSAAVSYFYDHILPQNNSNASTTGMTTINNALQTINQSFSGLSTTLTTQLNFYAQFNNEFQSTYSNITGGYTSAVTQMTSNQKSN